MWNETRLILNLNSLPFLCYLQRKYYKNVNNVKIDNHLHRNKVI